MHDIINKMNNSIIQHGLRNNRIYLMHLDKKDMPEIIFTLNNMANKNSYTKIFAKIPYSCSNAFLKNGYIIEATIPLFQGKEAFWLQNILILNEAVLKMLIWIKVLKMRSWRWYLYLLWRKMFSGQAPFFLEKQFLRTPCKWQTYTLGVWFLSISIFDPE